MAKRHRWSPGRNGYVGAVLSKGTAVITVRCVRCGAIKRHVHDQRGYHPEYGTSLDQKEWSRRAPPCITSDTDVDDGCLWRFTRLKKVKA